MTIVSIDIEADGPIPGRNSMLSLGAVAYNEDGCEFSAWTLNFCPLPGAVQDPSTMAWWSKQTPAVWKAATQGALDPGDATREFASWLHALPKPTKMLCSPVGFDFTFVRWYLTYFEGHDYLWHNAIDLRSVMVGITHDPADYNGKLRKKVRRLAGGGPLPPHTHVALDDAREQGGYFFHLMESAYTPPHLFDATEDETKPP